MGFFLGCADVLAGKCRASGVRKLTKVVWGVLLELSHPVLGLGEGLRAGDVVHDDCGPGSPVVQGGQGGIPLLSSSIPAQSDAVKGCSFHGMNQGHPHHDTHAVVQDGCRSLCTYSEV